MVLAHRVFGVGLIEGDVDGVEDESEGEVYVHEEDEEWDGFDCDLAEHLDQVAYRWVHLSHVEDLEEVEQYSTAALRRSALAKLTDLEKAALGISE